MEKMFDWINSNAAALSALTTVVLAFLTWRYVVLTGKLVNESSVSRREATRPAVSVSLVVHETSVNLMNLVVENTGTSAARDVRFKVDQPYFSSDGVVELAKVGIFAHGVPYFAPRQKFDFFFATAIGQLDRLREAPIKINAQYADTRGERYTDDFVIDLSVLEGYSRVGDPPIQTIAESTEALSKAVQSLSSGFSKLQVVAWTVEENDQRQRTSSLFMQLSSLRPEAFKRIEEAVTAELKAQTDTTPNLR